MIGAHLGSNVEIVAATEDSDFLDKLKSRKWTVVAFAPGACRWNAAKQPIPGSSAEAGTGRYTVCVRVSHVSTCLALTTY
jgi:hypothetical protein